MVEAEVAIAKRGELKRLHAELAVAPASSSGAGADGPSSTSPAPNGDGRPLARAPACSSVAALCSWPRRLLWRVVLSIEAYSAASEWCSSACVCPLPTLALRRRASHQPALLCAPIVCTRHKPLCRHNRHTPSAPRTSATGRRRASPGLAPARVTVRRAGGPGGGRAERGSVGVPRVRGARPARRRPEISRPEKTASRADPPASGRPTPRRARPPPLQLAKARARGPALPVRR